MQRIVDNALSHEALKFRRSLHQTIHNYHDLRLWQTTNIEKANIGDHMTYIQGRLGIQYTVICIIRGRLYTIRGCPITSKLCS